MSRMPRVTGCKKLLALAVAAAGIGVLGVGCGAAAAAGGGPQPVRYDVDARWSPSSRTLAGTESIQLRNDGGEDLTRIWLRLWPNSSIPGEADGCRRRRVTLGAISGATAARYAVACSAVELELTPLLAPGATAVVNLSFRVRVPTYEAQLGRSKGVDLLGRALPVLAVRDDGGWHLNPDTGTGDPAFSLAAAWHMTLRLPAALNAATTGVEQSNTVDRRSRERVIVADTPHARDFALAIGRLRRRSATVDGVRIRVFSSALATRSEARRALRNATDALRAYDGMFGAYGSPELDLVVTGLGEDSQEFPEIVFSDPDRATVAHEVAHQWFHGIVGNDEYGAPWLDESFAAWSEAQLVPGYYRCDTRRPLGRHRGGLARGLSYYERRRDEYVDVVYRGGACALTALERALGRARFLGLLREWVASHRYGVVHTSDFLALLSRADAGAAARWADLVGLETVASRARR